MFVDNNALKSLKVILPSIIYIAISYSLQDDCPLHSDKRVSYMHAIALKAYK